MLQDSSAKTLFRIAYYCWLFFCSTGGYYTVKTKFGLRIIAVNTALYYYDIKTKTLDDPADQFAWLDEELSLATSKGEKVILTNTVFRPLLTHFLIDRVVHFKFSVML